MSIFSSDYVKGDWNAVCDICGFDFKASELKENWKKQRVCVKDFEGKHPQMFVRSKEEKISTDWARVPSSSEVFTTADYIGPIVTTITFSALRRATVDATAGNCTLTLPSAATEFLYGNRYQVVRVDNSANTVSVNGLSVGSFESIIFQSNGLTWSLFGRNR
jgi:hypothetical protein